MKTLSFRKIRKIFSHCYCLYKRKKKNLDVVTQKKFEDLLSSLHRSLQEKDSQKANRLVEELQSLSKTHLPKTFLDKLRNFVGSVLFALVVAVVVRQMWFEFYNIPTGSMRPTFKEKDFVVVKKNDYGLNIPLANTHFYFNSNLLKRGNIIIFSGKGMDIPDVNTRYFYLFPGAKQYVKRLIGKPGDILYFYGGLIYGIDKEGNPIQEFEKTPWLSSIDHIPFIRFEGKVITPTISSQGIYTPVFLYQMNEPLAKLQLTHFGRLEGEKLFENPVSYGDLWGMNNYAMVRLLTKDQVQDFTYDFIESDETAPLYLELTHHPSISRLLLLKDEYHRTRPSLSYNRSVIPMKNEDLQKIFSNIYTARFVVKNGKIARYRMSPNSAFQSNPYLPTIDPSIPDGTYEFDKGILYQVKLGGYLKKLPLDHPLYLDTPERIQFFFNLGIEFDTRFSPLSKNQILIPSRYAYFRNGSLYLLGNSILSPDSPTLKKFLVLEEEKKWRDSTYQPFIDLGPPILEDGNLNIDLIQKAGLKIPEGMYLALGDNHAMSSDSRDFGFVPQNNLKGGANFIFWPPSSRWGKPFQPSYPWFSLPKIIIWISFGIIIVISFLYYRKKKNNELKF